MFLNSKMNQDMNCKIFVTSLQLQLTLRPFVVSSNTEKEIRLT